MREENNNDARERRLRIMSDRREQQSCLREENPLSYMIIVLLSET
jgi:hypothetical protein